MFFVVRSNDSFNFPLGLIKYIGIIVPFFYICLVNLRFRVKKQATWLNLVTFASQKYAYYMKFEPDHAVISEQ